MIQTYTRYLLSGRIHPESICTISSLSRPASSRYMEPDTSLIQNLQVSLFMSHLPHKNPIYWLSKSTLGIFPADESMQNQILMIQTYTRYLFSRRIHSESICTISSFLESICTISSLSFPASSRYIEPDIGLIWNLQVSSFVPHLLHKNSIYWLSKTILGIFLTDESMQNQIYCHGIFLADESMQNQIHCHAPLLRGTWSQIRAWFEIFG